MSAPARAHDKAALFDRRPSIPGVPLNFVTSISGESLGSSTESSVQGALFRRHRSEREIAGRLTPTASPMGSPHPVRRPSSGGVALSSSITPDKFTHGPRDSRPIHPSDDATARRTPGSARRIAAHPAGATEADANLAELAQLRVLFARREAELLAELREERRARAVETGELQQVLRRNGIMFKSASSANDLVDIKNGLRPVQHAKKPRAVPFEAISNVDVGAGGTGSPPSEQLEQAEAQIALLKANLERARERESETDALAQELVGARAALVRAQADEAELARLRAQLQRARSGESELESLAAELALARAELARGKTDAAEIARLRSGKGELETLKRELDLARTALARAKADEAELARVRADLARVRNVDAELTRVSAERARLATELASANAAAAEVKKLRAELELAREHEAERGRLKVDLAQARVDADVAKRNGASVEGARAAAVAELARIAAALARAEAELARKNEDHVRARGDELELNRLKAELTRARADGEVAKRDVLSADVARASSAAEASRLADELARARAELNARARGPDANELQLALGREKAAAETLRGQLRQAEAKRDDLIRKGTASAEDKAAAEALRGQLRQAEAELLRKGAGSAEDKAAAEALRAQLRQTEAELLRKGAASAEDKAAAEALRAQLNKTEAELLRKGAASAEDKAAAEALRAQLRQAEAELLRKDAGSAEDKAVAEALRAQLRENEAELLRKNAASAEHKAAAEALRGQLRRAEDERDELMRKNAANATEAQKIEAQLAAERARAAQRERDAADAARNAARADADAAAAAERARAAQRERDMAEAARTAARADADAVAAAERTRAAQRERDAADAARNAARADAEAAAAAERAADAEAKEIAALRKRLADAEAKLVAAPPSVHGVPKRVVLAPLEPVKASERARHAATLARAAVAKRYDASGGEEKPIAISDAAIHELGPRALIVPTVTSGKTTAILLPPEYARELKLEKLLADEAREGQGSEDLDYVTLALEVVSMVRSVNNKQPAASAADGPPPVLEGVAVAVLGPTGWEVKYQVLESSGELAMDLRRYGLFDVQLATLEGLVVADATLTIEPPQRVRPSSCYRFFDALNNDRVAQLDYTVTDSRGRTTTVSGVSDIRLTFDELPDGITLVQASDAQFDPTVIRFLKLGSYVRTEEVDAQFLNRKGTLSKGELRVVLAWSQRPADLDLHCVSSKGGHVYWSKKNAGEMQIDMDVTKGQGPETLTLEPKAGRSYRVFVHNYTASKDETVVVENDLALSVASVMLLNGSGLPAQRWEVPTNPVENRLYWDCFTIYCSEDKTIKIEVANALLELRPDKPLATDKVIKNAMQAIGAVNAFSPGANKSVAISERKR